MDTPSAEALLDAWERGLNKSSIEQSLALLASAYPDSPSQLAQLSIGQRDGRLLSLREQLFGSGIECLAICPTCSERLELLFQVADLQVELASNEHFSVQIAEYKIQFRLPNSLDLMVTSDATALLERCLLNVSLGGETQTLSQLPAEVIAEVIEEMAQADPQADLQINLSCPSCGDRWLSSFDIGSFLWSEIQAWAIRLLREVHLLASSYGWRESDILLMSAYRRRLYVEMLGK